MSSRLEQSKTNVCKRDNGQTLLEIAGRALNYQTNDILEQFQMRKKFKFLLKGSLIYPGKHIGVEFCIVVGNLNQEPWISPRILYCILVYQ